MTRWNSQYHDNGRYQVEHSHRSRRGRELICHGKWIQQGAGILALLGALSFLGALEWDSIFFVIICIILLLAAGVVYLNGYFYVREGKRDEWIEQGYNSDEPDPF